MRRPLLQTRGWPTNSATTSAPQLSVSSSAATVTSTPTATATLSLPIATVTYTPTPSPIETVTPSPSETPGIPETCGTPEPAQAQRAVWSPMQQNQTRAGPGGSLLRLAADIGAHSGIDATGTLVTIAQT